jgi:hypothetical protein
MQNKSPSLARAFVAAALRGDDALARAAADAAAPRRRLAAALRDAHAEALLRIAGLRAAAGGPLPATLRDRLVEEAEEQLHRLETIFAQLGERPRPGHRTASVAMPPAGAWSCRMGARLQAVEAEERRGAEDARVLRDLAHVSGQHLAARLLDLTAQERADAAGDIARLRMQGPAPPGRDRRPGAAGLRRARLG